MKGFDPTSFALGLLVATWGSVVLNVLSVTLGRRRGRRG